MKKKILFIFLAVLLLIGAGIWGLLMVHQQSNSISVEDIYRVATLSGDCTADEEDVLAFLRKTQSGKTAELIVSSAVSGEEQSVSGKSYSLRVVFDGDHYTLQEEGRTDEYLYFYSVSGTSPNSEIRQTLYILADEEYSHQQITQSFFSSQSTDHLDFVMVCYANR